MMDRSIGAVDVIAIVAEPCLMARVDVVVAVIQRPVLIRHTMRIVSIQCAAPGRQLTCTADHRGRTADQWPAIDRILLSRIDQRILPFLFCNFYSYKHLPFRS